MCRWNFAFALSFVMMASEASAGFESWQVSSNCGGAAFVSNWDLNIEDYTGEVHGNSTWTCCSGVNNRITGRIGADGSVVLIRHLRDRQAGLVQTWTGSYADKRTIDGNVTGTGGPCNWSAQVLRRRYKDYRR
jgi:hypothetical protein